MIIAPEETLAELAMAAGAGVTEFYLAPRSSSASHASCMIALALVSLSPFCLPRHRSTAARKSSWHRSTTCVPGHVVFGRPGLTTPAPMSPHCLTSALTAPSSF